MRWEVKKRRGGSTFEDGIGVMCLENVPMEFRYAIMMPCGGFAFGELAAVCKDQATAQAIADKMNAAVRHTVSDEELLGEITQDLAAQIPLLSAKKFVGEAEDRLLALLRHVREDERKRIRELI